MSYIALYVFNIVTNSTDLKSLILAFGHSQNRQGTLTPRNMNSLTAIAAEQAQDGEEEEWEREMRGWNGEEEVRLMAVHHTSHFCFHNINIWILSFNA